MQRIDELQSFIVLEYLLSEMPSKVRGVTVSMKPIDDLHLLVEYQYIFRPFVFRDLDVDITRNNKFTLIL